MITQEKILELQQIHVESPRKIPIAVFLEDNLAKKVEIVGGKTASLAELRSIPGIKVPEAFVLTTSLYDEITEQNKTIGDRIQNLDTATSGWMQAKLNQDDGRASLFEEIMTKGGEDIKKSMDAIEFKASAENEILQSYEELCRITEERETAVAVRSSGITEDGIDLSFAGQNETFLHKKGKEEVLDAVKKCLASQFTERAISYRNEARLKMLQEALKDNPKDMDGALRKSETFSHSESKLAVVVQRMVDAQSAGVGFSIDSKTGARLTHIDISYGLGEAVVGGKVTPDSYDIDPKTGKIIGRSLGEKEKKIIYAQKGTIEVDVEETDRKRFTISDEKAIKIADKIAAIRKKYGREVDTEFAMDSRGEIYFLQARPETVASKEDSMIVKMRSKIVPENIAKRARIIFNGGKTGSLGAANGIVVVADSIEDAKEIITKYEKKGERVILVTERTDPDWVPIMKKVNGIITRVGGPTCHAAIVSRELGVPCIVGAGGKFVSLKDYAGRAITLDAGGKIVYEGELPLEEVGDDIDVSELLQNPTKTVVGINIANIDQARKMHALAELGDKFKISLLRTEFLLEDIGVHVNALIDYDKGVIKNPDLKKKIEEKIAGYGSGEKYFKTKLTEGIAAFAALFPNSPITLRTTDFKTNEYKSLIGGKEYESVEPNPMMGDRGLGRYIHPDNREAFKLELEAIKEARDKGYKNIQVMFPMVRDLGELGDAYKNMEEAGLVRGVDGLKVGMMIEVPSNIFMLEEFAKLVDFFSIGSNDLTQFILAVDRDNEKLASSLRYAENNPAVVRVIKYVIKKSKELGVEIGICGQAPSNNPEFARMLVEEGIDSVGVTPDRFLATHRLIRKAEK